jgi:GDP-4-dehydro-6-deoxy-D-mannose reductase
MRILITGVTGFAGSHLAEALLAGGAVELFGIARHATWPPDCKHLSSQVPLWACDLTDAGALEGLLRDKKPGQIYHLAGYPHVGRSLKEPLAAWHGNLTASLNLYESVRRWGGRPRILHVSSGLVYEEPDSPGRALDERAPLSPATPYAASKAAADLAAYQYHRCWDLDIVRVRPFNHIGARQSMEFALSSFARQLAQIEAGKQPSLIETGDLAPQRDLTDVRDMVQAYMLLMKSGRPGEAYNAGSGQCHSMRTVLDRLCALSGRNPEIRAGAVAVRQTETRVLCAGSEKLQRETGWTRRFSLDQTLASILEYWRERT